MPPPASDQKLLANLGAWSGVTPSILVLASFENPTQLIWSFEPKFFGAPLRKSFMYFFRTSQVEVLDENNLLIIPEFQPMLLLSSTMQIKWV